ncbi:MAG: MATE family efflux transporter [Phycisphaerales bacterium]|jgi:O-antigen/teichoic acid export membrane protein|nr:MATE family efflux transporter [Phycisphaerales bacterium]
MSDKLISTPSEKLKGLHRIGTNYGRLIATMAMGIATVPLQFKWLGMDGFGLISLVGSSIGIGGMLQDMMRSSMVRELGDAWHRREDGKFQESFAAAFLVSAYVTILTALIFAGIIFLLLPVLDIPSNWLGSAQWITACSGISTCLVVLLAPTINMLVVREHFFWHNLWTVSSRSAFLIATIIPFLIFNVTDIPQGLTLFGYIIMIVGVASTLLLIGGFVIVDRRMFPTYRGSTREAMKKVAGTFGWNSGVVGAMNLHERVANYIMNYFFGLWGNAVFTLALRLVSYIRMASLGLTFGLDSVSARLSSTEDHTTLKSMFRHSTRMLGFVSFPAMVVVFVIAEPLLRMWVGRSIENPTEILPASEILVKIMVVGLACRAVSDGWMKLFYGAGHIRKYAPYVFAGGLFNPILSVLLIFILPTNIAFTGAAIAYSVVFFVVHMIIMPQVSAKSVGLTLGKILRPSFRPLAIAIAVAPTLLIPNYFSDTELMKWTGVIGSVCCYGIAYSVTSWCFLLSKRERGGIQRLILQLTKRQAGTR